MKYSRSRRSRRKNRGSRSAIHGEDIMFVVLGALLILAYNLAFNGFA